MSGPKSAQYRPSAAELERRAEERAHLVVTSRFRVLSSDLQMLGGVAAATGAAFDEPIVVPRQVQLRAGSAAEVESQNVELERVVTETRNHIRAAQKRGETKRLRMFLSTLGKLDLPAPEPHSESRDLAGGSAAPSELQAETIRARAETCLASLTAGAELSEHAVQLVASLGSAMPDLASLAVRDLQIEISRINREAKRKTKIAEGLRDLDIRAGVLGRPALLREVLFARGDPDAVTEEQLAALERRIVDEELRVAAAQDRSAARAAMEHALVAEGYEVLDGFDTAVPQDGVLVRKPGLAFHAWRVSVDDQSIHLDVVRTALEADTAVALIRDVEAETVICTDLPAVLSRVAEAGVEVGRIRQLAPGDAPVKVLPGARPAYRPAANTHKKKERSQ